MSVALVIPNWPAEAVELDDVLGIFIALRRQGTDVRVFTPNGQLPLPIEAGHYDDLGYLFGRPDDLVIYHQSGQDHAALPYLNRLQCRLIVKYHGAAPASSFLRLSDQSARLARQQRVSLHSVAQLPVDAFLAATELQATELQKLGVPARYISIVPSFHSVDRLRELPDDPRTRNAVEAHAVNAAIFDDIGPWSGIETLLAVVERLRSSRSSPLPLHLHLAGRQLPEMSSYIGGLMRSIAGMATACATFHPSTASVRATLLRHCDVVLFAQSGAGPGGRSLEALGFGRPVVTSPNNDAAELCGLVARCAATVPQFVDELQHTLLDQEKLSHLGAAAQARFASMFRASVLESRFIEELKAIHERALVRVEPSTMQPSGDWFGIPDPLPLINSALAVADPLHPAALQGTERRRSFVDWIIREGCRRSPEVMRHLTAPALLNFAKSLEVPHAASQLDAGMRLFWTFDRFARSAFDLNAREGVVRLIRWYRLEAAEGYTRIAAAASRLHAEQFG